MLVAAPSNIAVDHLAERISQTGLRVVRLQVGCRWARGCMCVCCVLHAAGSGRTASEAAWSVGALSPAPLNWPPPMHCPAPPCTVAGALARGGGHHGGAPHAALPGKAAGGAGQRWVGWAAMACQPSVAVEVHETPNSATRLAQVEHLEALELP